MNYKIKDLKDPRNTPADVSDLLLLKATLQKVSAEQKRKALNRLDKIELNRTANRIAKG